MMNKNNKYVMLRIASITSGCLGLATLLPFTAAINKSIIGYKSICSFAPVSTIILLYVSVTIHRYLLNLPGRK